MKELPRSVNVTIAVSFWLILVLAVAAIVAS